MEIIQIIKSFIQLGEFLREYSDGKTESDQSNQLNEIVLKDHIQNPWFTEQNIRESINAIGESLFG
ncbi:MAG: hypothetical protein K8R31_06760 [Bacteroidales bacterium]|nr:hypothetical protein [Bacteroidales bacterium]